jgi:hypothetical protein
MGFDLALSFLLPIPILSNFVSSWFMSFFLKIIGWKKMLQIYQVEGAFLFARSLGALNVLSGLYGPFFVFFMIAMFISFLTVVPLCSLIITYIDYWVNKRLFKKWFRIIDNMR